MTGAPANFDVAADQLRAAEFARLASLVVPTIESLRSLTPHRFRAEVAGMLDRLGYDLLTDENAALLIATKDGLTYVVACASPTLLEPTSMRDVARLHTAVVKENGAAGFYITARGFTGDAEAYAETAPIKLVDGKKLVASMQKSMADMAQPGAYRSMCRQCGEIVKHQLDKGDAIPCRNGHQVAPTIALAALVAPRRGDKSSSGEAAPKIFSRFEVRQHNAKYQAKKRRALAPKPPGKKSQPIRREAGNAPAAASTRRTAHARLPFAAGRKTRRRRSSSLTPCACLVGSTASFTRDPPVTKKGGISAGCAKNWNKLAYRKGRRSRVCRDPVNRKVWQYTDRINVGQAFRPLDYGRCPK